MTASVLTPLVNGSLEATLEDWGPLEEATDQPMATRGIEIWVEGEQSAGIWECEPGPSYWVLDTHEVIYLVAGSMTVVPEGGEARTISTGDMAVFPRGWKGTWTIHETVRKVYSIF